MNNKDTHIVMLNQIFELLNIKENVESGNYDQYISKNLDELTQVDSMKLIKLAAFLRKKLGYKVGSDKNELDNILKIEGLIKIFRLYGTNQ